MFTRKFFVCIVVLALCTLSCQGVSVVKATLIPTAELASIPTDTPAPTATRPSEIPTAVPQDRSTSADDHTPVISSVDLRSETSGGKMTVYQDIFFKDANADVYFVDYELISATAANLSITDGAVKTPAQEQRSGGKLTGVWNCGSNSYEASLTVRLNDKAGNKSTPYEYTIVCGQGEVQAGFPDLFDDNRNGWELDDQISIQDGLLQFRDIPETRSRWTYCDACSVTPDQNTVSVEASWSNTQNASLGLLIDDDTCTPDGLVFIITPVGYYRILQAVRDASGKWSHWRPFVEWTKSSLIHRAQNAKNVMSIVYDFGDELHVTFSLNGSRVTRVRVFGYNGSKECRPGLFADGGLEANFDIFSISNSNP
jgi:hypothetical protein